MFVLALAGFACGDDDTSMSALDADVADGTSASDASGGSEDASTNADGGVADASMQDGSMQDSGGGTPIPDGPPQMVEVIWSIGGETPNALTCGMLGAAQLSVRIFEGETELERPEAIPCNEDVMQRFELAPGDYSFVGVALGEDGSAFLETGRQSFEVRLDPIGINPVAELAAGTTRVAWTINAADPISSCAEVGATQVELSVLGDEGSFTLMRDCTAGGTDTIPDLPAGEYTVFATAQDDALYERAYGEANGAEPIVVTGPGADLGTIPMERSP